MPVMTLTSTAEQKIKELCAKQDKWAVHLSIKGGGCAGFPMIGDLWIKQI